MNKTKYVLGFLFADNGIVASACLSARRNPSGRPDY